MGLDLKNIFHIENTEISLRLRDNNAIDLTRRIFFSHLEAAVVYKLRQRGSPSLYGLITNVFVQGTTIIQFIHRLVLKV